MEIKQQTSSMITGHYKTLVRVGNKTVELDGDFEIPDSGSQSSRELTLELAIIIVSASNTDDLSKRVNDEIRLGWEPIGGVAVVQQLCDKTKRVNESNCTLYDAGVTFYQAMVKRP